MRRTAVVFMVFLLFASVSFAFIPTANQTQSKVNDAKDAKEEADDAVTAAQAEYEADFPRCPDLYSDWHDALNKLTIAEDLYDSAFEDYILGNYNDSYYDAFDSIEASNDAMDLLEGLPQRLYTCNVRERRENASSAMADMTDTKNEVEDSVKAKLGCPDVNANWTKAIEQFNFANTLFTGADYLRAEEAANLAIGYFEAADAAARTCVPPVIEEEPEIECEVDQHCGDDEICDLGQCIPVHCECGYVSNHRCHAYECCADEDCPPEQICSGHMCVSEQEPVNITVPEEKEAPEEPQDWADYQCFPGLILLALMGFVISRVA